MRSLDEQMRRPWIVTGATVGYLLFCLSVVTPLQKLAMLWPYFFMVFTSPLHGLTGGDYVSIAIGDVVGLVAIFATFSAITRFRRVRDLRPAIGLVIGFVSWPLVLFFLQLATWLLAGLVGWPTGI